MKYSLLFIFSSVFMLIGGQILLSQSKKYEPNPKGYLVERYGLTQKQESQINKFSHLRTIAIDSLASLGLSPQLYRQKRDSITDIYYARVQTVLTLDQQKKFNPEAMKAARTGEIKSLKLPVETEIAMGALKAEYEKSLKAIEGLSYKETKTKRAAIEAEYRRELRNLLGEDKYTEWLSYKNGAIERKFKSQFGFTNEQFKQYKAIEKWQAVQIMIVKNTETSPEERAAKVAEIKQAKVDSLRTLLPLEQFEKWYEYYRRKEMQRTYNR